MSSYYDLSFNFSLLDEKTIWRIPSCCVTDGSDSLVINSSWSKTNIQGSTEALTAFNYTDNPNLNINLKFHEDSWTTANLANNYVETVSKLVSLIYPSGENTIKPPYVIIAYANFIYCGYFSSIRCTQSGPVRKSRTTNIWYKPYCEFNGTFVVTKRSSPKQSGIVANGYNIYFAQK